MGYGEEVNTSDFDSDIRGFDSHYPCSFVYVFVFPGSNPGSLIGYMLTLHVATYVFHTYLNHCLIVSGIGFSFRH